MFRVYGHNILESGVLSKFKRTEPSHTLLTPVFFHADAVSSADYYSDAFSFPFKKLCAYTLHLAKWIDLLCSHPTCVYVNCQLSFISCLKNSSIFSLLVGKEIFLPASAVDSAFRYSKLICLFAAQDTAETQEPLVRSEPLKICKPNLPEWKQKIIIPLN